MKADFINPFLTASYSVLSMVLGTMPEKGAVKAQPQNTTHHQVNVVCGVTGQLQGQIILGMCQTTACRMASLMACKSLKFFDSFVASAIAELGNMISGNALMGLSESGYICDITPPTVIRGVNVEITTLNVAAISIHLETSCGELVVTVGLTEAAEALGNSYAEAG
jgi:chemotaxis protein CheX